MISIIMTYGWISNYNFWNSSKIKKWATPTIRWHNNNDTGISEQKWWPMWTYNWEKKCEFKAKSFVLGQIFILFRYVSNWIKNNMNRFSLLYTVQGAAIELSPFLQTLLLKGWQFYYHNLHPMQNLSDLTRPRFHINTNYPSISKFCKWWW